MDDLNSFFATIFDEAAHERAAHSCATHSCAPILLIHSALSSFGYVDGGAESVVTAMMHEAREREITLVMPFHSRGDTEVNGRIAAAFGASRKTVRSTHPELAFCASGPRARSLLSFHRAEYGLGEKSPLGKLYRADASILMLGTGYETCTAMHLAEYRLEGRDFVTCGSGRKQWIDIAYRTELFPGLGAAFEQAHPDRVKKGPMVEREWRLVRVKDIVDFCVDTSGYLR
jgi:aminoglycoside 3-N-acetyltransferase